MIAGLCGRGQILGTSHAVSAGRTQLRAEGPGQPGRVRKLGDLRLIAGKPAAATAPAQAASSAQPVVSLSNKQVQGTVSLAPELAKQAGPECTVFVFARGPDCPF